MRSTALASALALTAMLGAPALAQDAQQQQQQAAGQAQQAFPALQKAQQELQAAARQLEQASQANDPQALEQAKQEVQKAIDGVRQAMSQMPPEQRAELQESLRQAEQGMQITDPSSMIEAARRLVRAANTTPGTVVALSTWRYDPLYAEGWRSEEIWDAEIYGPEGQEIGDIENLLLGSDGQILSVVAEVGGIWDIGDTHINVPWQEVKVGPNFERITIPVNEDNVDDYSLFKDWHLTVGEAKAETTQVDDDLAVGPRVWKLTDILDDYVMLAGHVPYGYVDDVVFDRQGALKAILVRPDVSWGVPGYYAYPYQAWWDPGLGYHTLPYARADIEGLEPFDHERLEGNQPSEG
jgi:hypothetical protein